MTRDLHLLHAHVIKTTRELYTTTPRAIYLPLPVVTKELDNCFITSLPYIVSHWNGLYDTIPWEKVWTLSSKYLITKEVSYKLLHLFYPVKLYMKKMFPDIESLCSFCEAEDESMSHLFWECTYTNLYWKDLLIFIHAFSSQSLFLSYLVVITLLKKTMTNIF